MPFSPYFCSIIPQTTYYIEKTLRIMKIIRTKIADVCGGFTEKDKNTGYWDQRCERQVIDLICILRYDFGMIQNGG